MEQKFILEILSDKIEYCKVKFCKGFGLHKKERALQWIAIEIGLIFVYLFFGQGEGTSAITREPFIFVLIKAIILCASILKLLGMLL